MTQVQKLSAQKQLLQIKIQQAENNISHCDIKAPFAGIIARRLIHIGEHAVPGSPLLQLIDINNLEVEVQVPIVLVEELDYTALNFIHRNQSYPLKLRAIIPRIETRARHQQVRLNFINKKALPDAYGIVEITLQQIKIPANYLVTRNQQLGLFLAVESPVQEDAAEKQFTAHFYALKHALPGRAARIDLPLESKVIISGRNAVNHGQLLIVSDLSL